MEATESIDRRIYELVCQEGPGAVARFHEMVYQHEIRLLGPRGDTPRGHLEALRAMEKRIHLENQARKRAVKRTKATVGVDAWSAYRNAAAQGACRSRSRRQNAVTRIRATST
jgi:hypothetical protein